VVCGGEGISDAFYCFECTRLEKDRDGCPKIINLGSSRTDLFCKSTWNPGGGGMLCEMVLRWLRWLRFAAEGAALSGACAGFASLGWREGHWDKWLTCARQIKKRIHGICKASCGLTFRRFYAAIYIYPTANTFRSLGGSFFGDYDSTMMK
jgi:hypothetical protein